MRAWRSVVALSGGVGGARLVHGLDRALPSGALTTIVNTGDDFEHWGLSISPDVDTVMYTLADLAHVERGWGLAQESFETFAAMKRYGAQDWFALGDRDLATHLVRTAALRDGDTLTAVTARLAERLGLRSAILPMTDAPFRTLIETTTMGTLGFQDWLVRERAVPPVSQVVFAGTGAPAPGLIAAIERAELVVIGPSNPYVSIDPILALDGVRQAIFSKPVIALSPLVGGKAVKGPLGSMIREIDGRDPSARWLVDHYSRLSGVVVEQDDNVELGAIPVLSTSTLMRTRDDSLRLATEVLAFAERLS
jgi:LPPG:FO 2-phospho-L-lactate transferase